MPLRHTHTFSVLEVSSRTYNEIAARIREADRAEIIDAEGLIDMTGIALQVESEPRTAFVVNGDLDDLKS